MKGKRCPILVSGWISHYGAYNSDGTLDRYALCADDCAWYNKKVKGCVVHKFLSPSKERGFRRTDFKKINDTD